MCEIETVVPFSLAIIIRLFTNMDRGLSGIFSLRTSGINTTGRLSWSCYASIFLCLPASREVAKSVPIL